MSYFVVWDGAIHEAFDTLDEATALVAQHPGARVIGDEWLTVGKVKERVDQARRALDEVAMMIDPSEVQRMRQALGRAGSDVRRRVDPIGLGRRLEHVPADCPRTSS
jgi:hypothetical protein